MPVRRHGGLKGGLDPRRRAHHPPGTTHRWCRPKRGLLGWAGRAPGSCRCTSHQGSTVTEKNIGLSGWFARRKKVIATARVPPQDDHNGRDQLAPCALDVFVGGGVLGQ